ARPPCAARPRGAGGPAPRGAPPPLARARHGPGRGRRRRRRAPRGRRRGAVRRGGRLGRGARAPLLEERMRALTTAVELGEGIVPPDRLRPAREVLERAGARSALAPGVTVAALLGATGSGKSSLFNALVGEPLSAV